MRACECKTNETHTAGNLLQLLVAQFHIGLNIPVLVHALASFANRPYCGKTGSTETSDDKNKATNAWYTGFLFENDHPYAVSVVIEEGGAGGNLAAETAAKALKYAIQYVG